MQLKTRLCFFFLAVLTTISVHAKIIRVNNAVPSNEPTQNLYKSFNDAYIAAVGNDTIMIEGSATQYTNPNSSTFSIKKKLTILGPGYLLDKNAQTQASNLSAILYFAISFEAGSAGSYMAGIYLKNSYLYIRENNIFITRNYLESTIYLYSRYDGVKYESISGIRITSNYIGGNFLPNFNFGTGFSDLSFSNNIILGRIDAPSSTNYPYIFTNVDNNTFYTSGSFALSASTFRNNVLIIGVNSTLTINCPNISNNLIDNDKLGTANGNRIYSVNDGSLFAGNITDFDADPDNEFKVVNTRFNTMGSDGKEPGAFGGANPYVLSGLPQIPAIYELSTTGTGSAATGLPVTIKVKSN